MNKELQTALIQMTRRVAALLSTCEPSVFLYGSVALDDFRPGWSDIDILVLTNTQISEDQAKRLVTLRETMMEATGDAYCRAFEGGMLTLDAFASGKPDRVVYWGTGGARIIDRYRLDAFCMSELLESGVLLHGRDVRMRFERPEYAELALAAKRHCETIRKYARQTDRSLYSYGWLLDISRCIYTLRTGRIIAKTAAGEWALCEGICPCAEALARAVEVRRAPAKYKADKHTLDYAQTLGDSVQSYADVLENELDKCL